MSNTASNSKDSSIFTVLYSLKSGSVRRRRWLTGRLYISFHKTSLVDDETRKCVCSLSGTGIHPNNIFTLMKLADKGAGWESGTELSVAKYSIQIEEVMHLHLLPYATFNNNNNNNNNNNSQSEAANVPRTSVITTRGAATATDSSVMKNMLNLSIENNEEEEEKKNLHVKTEYNMNTIHLRRRTSYQIIQELEEAYPQFFPMI